ncbi:M28 family metallopeptidase [Tundrisphaera sp. TA3]|uniref:M28 family metallopeptidase n=1 Tax=Tundrisphaera sp. TA3 TaxID=3435775 RepID=UPI003EBEA05D
MLRCRTLGGLGLVALAMISVPGRAQDGPIGFAPASRKAQGKAEAHALGVPTPDAARAWLHELTEEPHVAGTPADRKTADFLADKLRSWGWQVQIEEYEALLNYPKLGSVVCELVRPEPVPLKVVEDPLAVDKDSASADVFPAFHGYGVSGDVTAQVVYANYGRPEDFATLTRIGVDVRGKIVLVRYGELFRGLKVRNAQKAGAKGVLIYSDPAEDGYTKGDTYPGGPFRPASALQRGSVQFLSLGPGDPSTPDGPSIKGAKRLAWDPQHGFPLEAPADAPPAVIAQKAAEIKAWEQAAKVARVDYFASIPSLPISYEAARPILAAMGGANVPAGWQGGLPLAYHVGPGPAEVRLAVAMDYQIRPIWNVVATIKGEVEPDRWVMIGNHRDAWVYGAVDPGSGTSATLETCRALGSAVVKLGWKPRRTLHYSSWDAEEYGLVGSTEWADHHAQEIDEKAVLMLNVDSAVSGPDLDLDGVPSLRDLVLEAAGAVTDVRSNRPILDDWLAKRRAAWAGTGPLELDDLWGPATPGTPPPARKFSPKMNPLGSGSDYTAFVDHLGVPAVDIGFNGRYGVYHSVYDSFHWMEKYGDPEFLTHASAAKLYTLIAMRAANAEVIPFRFVPYGEAIREYVDDLRRQVARKARAAEATPARPAFAFEGLPRLVASIKGFEAQAAAVDAATEALARRDGVAPAQLARVNDALVRVERAFLLPNGLPGRPWFRHAIYAPGLTTGYASWPLPGVRQAIEDQDPALLADQVNALAERIDAAAAALRAVTVAATTEPTPPAPAPAPAAAPAPAPAPAVAPAPAQPAAPPPGRGGR